MIKLKAVLFFSATLNAMADGCTICKLTSLHNITYQSHWNITLHCFFFHHPPVFIYQLFVMTSLSKKLCSQESEKMIGCQVMFHFSLFFSWSRISYSPHFNHSSNNVHEINKCCPSFFERWDDVHDNNLFFFQYWRWFFSAAAAFFLLRIVVHFKDRMHGAKS